MKKTEFILYSEQSARNPGFLLIFTGWVKSGKVILQVSVAVFSGAVENFSGKDGSAPPHKKLAHMPMLATIRKDQSYHNLSVEDVTELALDRPL